MTVLVVEDEPDIREAVVEVLAEAGYDAVGATDGRDGLEKLHACHPALVLLDLMMPGMDGWAFRAAQRGDPEVSRIPVIIVSALGPGGRPGCGRVHREAVRARAAPHGGPAPRTRVGA
jgi:CheY-like chemotaxis protein